MMTESKSTKHGWQSPVVLMRASAILLLLTALGHLSAYPWTSSTHDPRESMLVESMNQTPYMFFSNTPYAYFGEHTSYWGLYFGWGLLVGAQILTSGLILWILSGLTQVGSRSVAAICAIFSAVSLIGAYISLRFFFTPPIVSYSIVCILLAIAAAKLWKRPDQQSWRT